MEPFLYREKDELLALCSLPWIRQRHVRKLLEVFGSPSRAWSAVRSRQASAAVRIPAEVEEWSRSVDPARLSASMERAGVRAVVLTEQGYPPRLAAIDTPPFAVFYRGTLPEDEAAVAIVGSRKATSYGAEVARSLARGLAACGVTVVSGAAHGIDSFAHLGALDGGARTVAVLGCGPDVAYPPSNANLLENIAASGCVMSEYPPGARPSRSAFPERNRIIAGLSLGVVVVEAPAKSGALITSDFAASYSREVMAVPGGVLSSRSEGCNELIRSGAALVRHVDDVLDEVGLTSRIPIAEGKGPDGEAMQVLKAMAAGTLEIDELSRAAGLSSGETMIALSELEIEGLARKAQGGLFQVTSAGYQLVKR